MEVLGASGSGASEGHNFIDTSISEDILSGSLRVRENESDIGLSLLSDVLGVRADQSGKEWVCAFSRKNYLARSAL